MRFITLDSENKVVGIRNGTTAVDGEIQSNTGELDQIMQLDGTFIDSISPLEQVKNSKLNEIGNAYNQKLSGGFISSATATAHTFGYGQSDREKFMQLAISVLSNIAVFPLPIPAKDGTLVLHDQTQYQQLVQDISAFGWYCQNKHYGYIEQARSAQSIDDVNAIVVTF